MRGQRRLRRALTCDGEKDAAGVMLLVVRVDAKRCGEVVRLVVDDPVTKFEAEFGQESSARGEAGRLAKVADIFTPRRIFWPPVSWVKTCVLEDEK